MRKWTVLLVAALLVGAVGGPAAGLAGANVTLEVVVRTAAGGPVGNADVTASWEAGPSWDADAVTRTTAGNGRVFIDAPEGANVTLEVEHPKYVRNAPYELTDASDEEVEVTVWERATASLSVEDSDGPVEDARVMLRKGGNIVGPYRTDAGGTMSTGAIEAGEYTAVVTKNGYYDRFVSLSVKGDAEETVTVERGSVTVEFLVVDDNFDPPRPVAEATIDGPDFDAATGSDGTRSVSLPVNTDLAVTVEKQGFESVRRAVVVGEQPKEVTISTRKLDAVRLDVANERVVVGETVQVTVTDEYDQPLPGATVYLDGESVGEPNDDGVLQVTIDSEGEHTVFAEFEQVTSSRIDIAGVESGSGGTPVPDADDSPATVAPSGGDERPAGFLGVPAIGPLHLRSTAIGTAGGLVIAAVLFLYVRFG